MKGWMYVFAFATLIGVSGNAFGQRGDSYGLGKGHGHNGYDRNDAKARKDPKGNFSNRIYRITEADSVQAKKMKPVVDRASKRLEALRLSFQKQEKRVMDSLSLQVKPMLKEDQWKRLDDFNYHYQDRAQRRK